MMHATARVALCGFTLTLSALGAGDPPAAVSAPATVPEAAQPPAADTQRPSSAAVLARMRERYTKARTYRDTGTSVSKLAPGGERQLKFSTVFDRNAGFRWRFVAGDEARAYEVWSMDQKTWNSWWGVTGESERFNDFESAIAGPTGISSGTVQMVPVMLVIGPRQCSLLQTLRPQPQVERQTIGGVACDVVSGARFDRTIRLWIDDQGALRQFTESYDIDPERMAKAHPEDDNLKGRKLEKFHVDHTVQYDPTFDAPVKPDETTFTPKEL